MSAVRLIVNRRECQVSAHPLALFLDVLRVALGLTGTKEGCGEGECGACTVLVEGLPVLACLVPVRHAEGKKIVAIEGPRERRRPSSAARAFHQEGAAQCGICTPEMILPAAYYLEHPEAVEDVQEALAGNQCRCTGYMRIFEAVEKASRERYTKSGDGCRCSRLSAPF